MEEMLPMTQAVARVYGRLGEKRNRQKARIKFLVQKLGLEEFKRLVEEERQALPFDARWTSWMEGIDCFEETPLKSNGLIQVTRALPKGYREWHETNVYKQRQPGYNVVTVALPLGDITATQLRKLADIARNYVKEAVRTTVEQNIILRWIHDDDLIPIYNELKSVKLDAAGAGTVVDLVSCPGTD